MYLDRWQKLRAKIDGDGPIVITGHSAMQRRGDSAFAFSQEASFLWLTGINEADWWAIFYNNELILVAPKRSDMQVIFEGGISQANVIASTQASRVIDPEEADSLLKKLSKEQRRVYTIGKHSHEKYDTFTKNPAQARLRRILGKYFAETDNCRPALARLRAIKTDAEVTLIRHAISATIDGFNQLKARLSDAKYEYQLEATLNAAFRETGAQGHAYDPIVAGAKNACTLHYSANQEVLPKNGLVLVDAGAVVDGYAADITRTYAVGRPTPRQAQVHAAVQAAHYRIIDLIKPGLSLKSYTDAADAIMKNALESLGLLADSSDDVQYRRYFPHAVSHGLGIDVHESLGGYDVFMPGMVLTVEPGVYIPEEGVGVRIEDDILVTADGSENLSAALATSL